MASPEEIIAAESEIVKYIPQRPPMVMVGRLISAGDRKTVTSFTITRDNLFFDGTHFTEPGLIENIAQTAAAGAGYRASLAGQSPSPGFIGGIKNLVIHSLPLEGDLLVTEVTVGHEIFDATVITGQSMVNNRMIAECEMKIFIRRSES